MKKRTLLTCCVLAGALSLSGTAHASEISDQNMIENSGQSQNSSPDAESANTSQNTGSKNEASSTEKEIIAGTNMYEAGEIPFNTNVPGRVEGNIYAWYSFTTGSTAGTEYTIVCTNTSPGTYSLDFALYDDLGTELTKNQANSNGTPSTVISNELNPDTTYYIRINSEVQEDTDFFLSVKNPSLESAENTEAANTSEQPEITAGTNMYDAGEMPLNTNVPGHIKGDYRDTTSAWYSFTTGSTAETEYTVVCTNTSPGTCSLDFVLYDDLGAELAQNQAENNGVTSTIVSSELTPDTTYYIQVSLNLWDDIDFILSVKDSTSESAENTKVKAVAE